MAPNDGNTPTTRSGFASAATGTAAPRAPLLPAHQRWLRLNEEDREILLRTGAGMEPREIGRLLHLSANFIEGRITNILGKINLKSVKDVPTFLMNVDLTSEQALKISAIHPGSLSGLSANERAIADYLTERMSKPAIARELKMGSGDVLEYIDSMKEKLGLASEEQIAALIIVEQSRLRSAARAQQKQQHSAAPEAQTPTSEQR